MDDNDDKEPNVADDTDFINKLKDAVAGVSREFDDKLADALRKQREDFEKESSSSRAAVEEHKGMLSQIMEKLKAMDEQKKPEQKVTITKPPEEIKPPQANPQENQPPSQQSINQAANDNTRRRGFFEKWL